jgi:hypothetical protein
VGVAADAQALLVLGVAATGGAVATPVLVCGAVAIAGLAGYSIYRDWRTGETLDKIPEIERFLSGYIRKEALQDAAFEKVLVRLMDDPAAVAAIPPGIGVQPLAALLAIIQAGGEERERLLAQQTGMVESLKTLIVERFDALQAAVELNTDMLTEIVDDRLARLKHGVHVIDRAYLESLRASRLADSKLIKYFDGAVPRWEHAVSGRVAHRSGVGRLVGQIRGCLSAPEEISTHVLVGAGAEGKSTMLLQTAARLILDKACIGIDLFDDAWDPGVLRTLPEGEGPWLLVADEADRHTRKLVEALRLLDSLDRTDVHLLLATRDTHWLDMQRTTTGTGDFQRLSDYQRVEVRGLDRVDAAGIVESWSDPSVIGRALGSLAHASKDNRAVMFAAAAGRAGPGGGTLFGAILDVRYSSGKLRERVASIMEGLARIPIRGSQNESTLFHAFRWICLCEAAGLGGIDRELLAALCKVDAHFARSNIEIPLGDEAGGVRTGRIVATRHFRIAREAVSLLREDSRFRCDLGEYYGYLVEVAAAVIDTARTPGMNRYEHLGKALIEALGTLVPDKEERLAIALRAADASIQAHKRLDLVVSKSEIYEKLGRHGQAARVIEECWPDHAEYANAEQVSRGLCQQWGVCLGNDGDIWANVYLLAYALSDQLTPAGASLRHAGRYARSLADVLLRLRAALLREGSPESSVVGSIETAAAAASRIARKVDRHPQDQAGALSAERTVRALRELRVPDIDPHHCREALEAACAVVLGADGGHARLRQMLAASLTFSSLEALYRAGEGG